MIKPSTVPEWATADNYPAGAEPEAGTPTKTIALAGKIATGFRPEEYPPAQEINSVLGRQGDWIRFVQNRIGRAHVVETNWYPDPTLDGWDTSVLATGAATVGVDNGPDRGPGLLLAAAAVGDMSQGYGPGIVKAPMPDGFDTILEVEVDGQFIAGVPDVSCEIGLMDDPATNTADLFAVDAAWFRKDDASANWIVRLRTPGGTDISTDTGVVCDGTQRLAIAWRGADVTASGDEEINFYIDGELVESFNSTDETLPAGAGGAVAPFARYRNINGAALTVKVSPMAVLTSRYREA